MQKLCKVEAQILVIGGYFMILDIEGRPNT